MIEYIVEYTDFSVYYNDVKIGLVYKRRDDPWVARPNDGMTTHKAETREEATEWLVKKWLASNA